MVRNGLELEFESPPTMIHFPSNARMGEERMSIERDEVGSLIQEEAVVRASRIRLVAGKLSGRSTESRAFRERWSCYSWGPSEQYHQRVR